MKTLKILSGVVSFMFAALSLLMVGLIVLASMAQKGGNAAASPTTSGSIMIGPCTLSGWQIDVAVGLLVILTVAFILGGVYGVRSSKTAA